MNSGMLFLWTTWRDPPHYNKKANFSTRGRTRTAYMSSSVGSGLNLNGPAAAESSCPTSPRSPSPAVDIPPTSLSRAGANPAPRSEPPPGFRPITVSRCVPGAGLKDDPIICKDFCYSLALLQPGPIRKEFQVCFLSVFFSLSVSLWTFSVQVKLLKGKGTDSIWERYWSRKPNACLMGARWRQSEMAGAEEAGPVRAKTPRTQSVRGYFTWIVFTQFERG